MPIGSRSAITTATVRGNTRRSVASATHGAARSRSRHCVEVHGQHVRALEAVEPRQHLAPRHPGVALDGDARHLERVGREHEPHDRCRRRARATSRRQGDADRRDQHRPPARGAVPATRARGGIACLPERQRASCPRLLARQRREESLRHRPNRARTQRQHRVAGPRCGGEVVGERVDGLTTAPDVRCHGPRSRPAPRP